jgi:hypothetical protein
MTGLFETTAASPGVPIPESRHTRNQITYLYSMTMRREVVLEGPYEPYHCLLLDVNPEVVWLQEQPIKVKTRINGRPLTHIFDLAARYRSGETVYFNFKAENDLVTLPNGTRAPPKWDLLVAWADANGINVVYRTEQILKSNTLWLENWWRLMPFVRQYQKESRPDVYDAADEFIRLARVTTPKELTERLCGFPSTMLLGAVIDGVRVGRYQAPLQKSRFTWGTEITWEG